MNIMIDDDVTDRPTPNGFTRFTTGFDLLAWHEQHPNAVIEFITFDNDLGLTQPQGYELVQRLIEELWFVRHVNIHSTNIVAASNMKQILESAIRHQQLPVMPVTMYDLNRYTNYVTEFKSVIDDACFLHLDTTHQNLKDAIAKFNMIYDDTLNPVWPLITKGKYKEIAEQIKQFNAISTNQLLISDISDEQLYNRSFHIDTVSDHCFADNVYNDQYRDDIELHTLYLLSQYTSSLQIVDEYRIYENDKLTDAEYDEILDRVKNQYKSAIFSTAKLVPKHDLANNLVCVRFDMNRNYGC